MKMWEEETGEKRNQLFVSACDSSTDTRALRHVWKRESVAEDAVVDSVTDKNRKKKKIQRNEENENI